MLKVRVLVEDVADVKDHCIVAHRTAVEELPSPILLVEDEQDRQLVAVNCTAHEGGTTTSVGHTRIVGARLGESPLS
jgi:hypothetical protein